jgi:hypothetical protein
MLKPAETSQSPITIINADGEIHIVEVMRFWSRRPAWSSAARCSLASWPSVCLF